MKKFLCITFFVGLCAYVFSKYEFQITVRKRQCKPDDKAPETETTEEATNTQ